MFPFLVFCVSLGFLIPGAVGARPIEQFKNPPDASTKPESAGKNPVYKVGDRVEFSWTTNADKVDLYILQGSDRGGGVTIDTDVTANSFKWKVMINGSDDSPKFDLMKSNQFLLQIYEPGSDTGADPLAQSVSFNITDSAVDTQGRKISSSSSSSSPSSSSTTASTISSTQLTAFITTSSSTSTTATPSASPTSSPPPKKLDTAAKAGIGIGIGLGAFALVGTVLFIMYRAVNKSRQQHGVDPNPAAWARGEQGVNIPMSANTATHAPNAPLLAH